MQLERRLEQARSEMANYQELLWDLEIENVDLDEAYEELRSFLVGEGLF